MKKTNQKQDKKKPTTNDNNQNINNSNNNNNNKISIYTKKCFSSTDMDEKANSVEMDAVARACHLL